MSRRGEQCDVLGEIRKAMRALRRAEKYLAAKERRERALDREFERKRKADAELEVATANAEAKGRLQ